MIDKVLLEYPKQHKGLCKLYKSVEMYSKNRCLKNVNQQDVLKAFLKMHDES